MFSLPCYVFLVAHALNKRDDTMVEWLNVSNEVLRGFCLSEGRRTKSKCRMFAKSDQEKEFDP